MRKKIKIMLVMSITSLFVFGIPYITTYNHKESPMHTFTAQDENPPLKYCPNRDENPPLNTFIV